MVMLNYPYIKASALKQYFYAGHESIIHFSFWFIDLGFNVLPTAKVIWRRDFSFW